MNDSIVDSLSQIGVRAHGYGPLPIPTQLDNEISLIIDRWLEIPPDQRITDVSKVKGEQRDILLAYSERMASYAVRTGDERALLRGLLALGLDGWQVDWRDNTALLALYNDAAIRTHVSLETLFAKAEKFLSLNVSRSFHYFLKRNPREKSLQAMGYEVANDEGGFRYRRNW